jgi:hypothetical protein
MKKIIRLTEADLTKLVSRVIKEQKQIQRESTAKRFITEAMAQAQMLVDKAEEMVNSGQKPDPSVAKKVLDCINQEGFTHLAVTALGGMTYAFGMICAILGTAGSMFTGGMSLAIGGAILLFLEGVGINGVGVKEEVDRLVKCYSSKK